MAVAGSPLGLVVQTEQQRRVLRGRRKLIKLPKPPRDIFPVPLEREYRSKILSFFDIIRELIREELIPQLPGLARAAAPRIDEERYDQGNWAADLNRIFTGIDTRKEAAGVGFRDPKQFADETARGIARSNLRSIRRQMKSVLGLDIFINDSNLQGVLDSFGFENARLIKTMNEDFIQRIQTITTQALRQGARAESITPLILEALATEEKKTRERAALIARDQLGSLRADITKERHLQLGIESYFWEDSDDDRVRPSHEARDGKEFKYSDPPPDGNPGKPIRCRCTARPNLDALL